MNLAEKSVDMIRSKLKGDKTSRITSKSREMSISKKSLKSKNRKTRHQKTTSDFNLAGLVSQIETLRDSVSREREKSKTRRRSADKNEYGNN